SVGKATRPPPRSSAAASSRSAGDRALRSRVSTSPNAFEGSVVDALADESRNRAAPGGLEIGYLRFQEALHQERAPAHLADVREGRSRRLADRLDPLPALRRVRDQDPRGVLAEEQRVGPELRLELDAATQVPGEAHLRKRHREAAVGAVVRGLQ